jgi:hypothetical protein
MLGIKKFELPCLIRAALFSLRNLRPDNESTKKTGMDYFG